MDGIGFFCHSKALCLLKRSGYIITAPSIFVNTFELVSAWSIAVTTVLLGTFTINAISSTSTSESFTPLLSAAAIPFEDACSGRRKD